MKPLTLLLCLTALALASPAWSQTPPPQSLKYWIFFQDKLGPAGKETVAEPGYVSARALERRRTRGTLPPPTLDAPLSAFYLDVLARLNITPQARSRWLNAASAVLTPDQVKRVQKLPFVRSVRPVGRAMRRPEPLPASLPPAAPSADKSATSARLDYGPSRTQLEIINAIEPLERGLDGSEVLLGFLDAEYGEFAHPVFSRLVGEGRLVEVRSFVDSLQTNLHGRAVASVAVGYAEGMLIGPAHGADVLAATTEYAPTETNQEEDNFVAGLEWLEAQGVDVVNVSLGYTTFDAGQHSYTYADMDGDTGVTTRAADRAAALGVVVVTSAGNEGSCAAPSPTCWYYVGTPADGDSVIAVGAVGPDSTRAPFSSFGPAADGRIKPDVAAPGWNVYVANSASGYGFSSGTSFASPLVAGVVCQMLQANPSLTPIQVRDLLQATASQAAAPDNALGWGIINAAAAIAQAEALSPVATEPPLRLASVDRVRAYPNPFSRRVTFELEAPSRVAGANLSLYDALGRRVAGPFALTLQPGLNRIDVDNPGLSPGVYLYALTGESIRASGRLVVVR